MEINVNVLITDLNPAELSGSKAERGDNAGPETWNNSMEAAKEHAPIVAPEQQQGVRAWLGEFGAWDAEEIAAWSAQELDALVLQYAAGDLRELQSVAPGDGVGEIDWDEAESLAQEGTVGGNLFIHDDELWIMIS